MPSKKALAVAFFGVLVGAPGCAVQAQNGEPSDVGDTSEALTVACDLSRAHILASVGSDRASAIQRGFGWYDARVPYSQTREHAGYRTDCSGFVSMAWNLGTSFTTSDFYSGGGESSRLASFGSLLPADALVRRSGGAGHMVMFVGWNDDAHTSACVLEQESTAVDMQFHARSTASLTSGGYRAIRADEFGTSSGVGAGSGAPPAAGGAACHSDGDCNPGNDGSGQICSAGTCVDGCHSSSQCPGSTTCRAGSCS